MSNNQSKHTPGPWGITKHGTPDYAPQFGIYSEHDPHGFPDHCIVKGEFAKADAALIASAPDLLVALEEVMAELDDREVPQGAIWLDTGGMMLARAAIAKAKGESCES